MGAKDHGFAALLSETEIQQQIRLQCSRGPVRLWRNNSGSLPDPRTGRYVTFGVGSPGGSDLIGYRKVTRNAGDGRSRDSDICSDRGEDAEG
jgi:hypothetical protein